MALGDSDFLPAVGDFQFVDVALFDEVELGLTEEMARRETERCLQCGLVCYRGYREKVS